MEERQSSIFSLRTAIILASILLALWVIGAGSNSLYAADKASKAQMALADQSLAFVRQENPQAAESLEAQHELAQRLTQSAAASLAILLIVTILASIALHASFARFVGLPLAALVAFARRYGNGELDERITGDYPGELSTLASTLNQMAERIQACNLENEKLAQEAEAACEYQNQLVLRVSHELRTPLGVILGLAEMMQYRVLGPLTPQQHEATLKIIDHTRQLGKTYNQLVDQSDFDIQQHFVHICRFSPSELLERLQIYYAHDLHMDNLTVRTHIEPDLPGILFGDATRIEEILFRLVELAVTYHDRGEIRVQLGLQDDTHWAMTVCHTTAAIPDERPAVILEPNSQAEYRMAGNHDEQRLSLSFVQKLSEAMDGEVRMPDLESQGSAFSVILPLDPKMEYK